MKIRNSVIYFGILIFIYITIFYVFIPLFFSILQAGGGTYILFAGGRIKDNEYFFYVTSILIILIVIFSVFNFKFYKK